MHHTFDIDFAAKYGVLESIMLTNFQFWIQKNHASGLHRHDDRTWTYNSTRAYSQLLPYLTENQVRRTLESLVEQGILMRGNYNQNPYDRTSWFAFVDEEKFIGFEFLHSAFSPNGKGADAKSNTDINQIEIPVVPTKKGWHLPEWIPAEAWKSFEELRRKRKKPMTDRARALAVTKLEHLKVAGQNIQQVIDQTVLHGWDTFYAVKTEQQRNSYGKPAHDGKTDEYGVLL